MFGKVSIISLVVLTCAATAVLMRSDKSQEQTDEPCSGDSGQKETPFTCSDGVAEDSFACLNINRMIYRSCISCRKKELMSQWHLAQCTKILGENTQSESNSETVNLKGVKGLKVLCGADIRTDDADEGCVFPAVGAKRNLNFGKTGPAEICECVKQFVGDCKNHGLSCVLGKINHCPKICSSTKGQINDAQELKKRASVLVDAHGKAVRNASASIVALDHAMSGKCSQ